MESNRLLTEAELGYAAGFFDGEGYIGICGSVTPLYNSLCLEIDATQVDPRPLQWLVSRFGGKVKLRVRRQYRSTRNSRPGYCWRLHGDKAISFLKSIYPYLIHKKDQADLAFQFQSIYNKNKWSKQIDVKPQKLDIKNQLKLVKKQIYSAVA